MVPVPVGVMTNETDRQREATTSRTDGSGSGAFEEKDLAIQWVFGGAYGERHVLRGARLRIGRDAGCHLRLEHSSVSREHAELYRQGPIYALRDADSTNGTYLNGRRTEHAVLADGDVLRVGDYVGIATLVGRKAEMVTFRELAPGLFGGTTLMSALVTLSAVAATDIPVVLIGETGTGKECVARAIHHLSKRKGRFHALNCSALPTGLAEAELFGHQRGAFTGAERARAGHIRAAHEGTLFLDEVADLPLAVQAKLLRAIEEREVVPLGDTEAVAAEARIIVAAHEPLERFVEQKTFRADLHARLAGFRLELPPLRSRRDEVPGLFFRVLTKHASGRTPGIDAKLVELLCLYAWPGNVRELELLARKLLALHGDEVVLRRQHAEALLAAPTSPEPHDEPVEKFRDRRHRDLHRLKAALEKNDGNMTAAAASAGISRRRAYRLLDEAASQARGNGHVDTAPPSDGEPT